VTCADMREDSPEHHRQRSEFIRGLVQQSAGKVPINDRYKQGPPRTIVQFWHDLKELPKDIEECIASWSRWTTSGFTHCLFDERSAKAFIGDALDARHARAFDRCYHPAMQADYFRLCYLLIEGGLYVDADDVCVGTQISWLFDDGRLKLQPLCYDIASEAMVNTTNFLCIGAYEPSWIFYVNNNPLQAAGIRSSSARSNERLSFSTALATTCCQRYRKRPDPEIYRGQSSRLAPFQKELSVISWCCEIGNHSLSPDGH
jgi:hypothetical protein